MDIKYDYVSSQHTNIVLVLDKSIVSNMGLSKSVGVGFFSRQSWLIRENRELFSHE